MLTEHRVIDVIKDTSRLIQLVLTVRQKILFVLSVIVMVVLNALVGFLSLEENVLHVNYKMGV